MAPVARRVFGEGNEITLRMRWNYGQTVKQDPAATLDDLHEAVTMLEETRRIARRVLGGAHPFAAEIEKSLQGLRAALDAREALEPGDVTSIREAMGAMAPGGA